jgi:hypothetical protein
MSREFLLFISLLIIIFLLSSQQYEYFNSNPIPINEIFKSFMQNLNKPNINIPEQKISKYNTKIRNKQTKSKTKDKKKNKKKSTSFFSSLTSIFTTKKKK